PGSATISHADFQRGRADELLAGCAQFPTGHPAALDFDLRIVDGIVRLTPPAAQVDVGLALGTAQQRARNPHFRIAAIAAVHVLLERADDSLPIVVTA